MDRKRRKRIGIMGGTFDPIHIGHLIIGEAAYNQFGLDRVLFMPSGNPPHKRNRAGRASDAERTEMVRRAIRGNPHFELCLYEMKAGGYSYTYRTMEHFQKENPDTDYYFIIGGDSLYAFHTWMKPERIANACTIVAATRDLIDSAEFDRMLAFRENQYHSHFLRLDTPELDISSHNLREKIQDGKSVRYYIPDSVIEYIREQNIYGYVDHMYGNTDAFVR